MGKYPQGILYVGSSGSSNGSKIIKANSTGIISYYESHDLAWIEVEFADTALHKKLIFDNKDNFTMGDISEKGVVLASRGKVENIDEYEDEEELDNNN